MKYLRIYVYTVGFLLAICLCGPAVAMDPIVISRPTAVDPKEAILLDRSRLETRITIENPTDKPRTITFVATSFIELDGKESAPATWTFVTASNSVPLLKAGTPVTLEAKGKYSIELKATFGAPGKYRALLDVLEKDQPLKRFPVDVIRNPQLLDSKTFSIPAAAYVHECQLDETYGLCPVLPIRIAASLQNTTNSTLDLRSIQVAGVTAKRSGIDVVFTGPKNANSVAITSAITPCAAPGNTISVPPLSACDVELVLSGVPGAGEYAVKLNAYGGTGGVAENTVNLKIRNAWWWCAIVLLVGAMVGMFVNNWRTKGRIVATALYDVARSVETLSQLESKIAAVDAKQAMATVVTYADNLRKDLHSGKETDFTLAPALYQRALVFTRWAEYEAIFIQFDKPAQQKVQKTRDESLGALRDVKSTFVTLETTLSAFKTALEAALETARRQAGQRAVLERLRDEYEPGLKRDAQVPGDAPTDVSKAAEAALAALRRVSDSIDSASYDAATTDQIIEAAKASLANYMQQRGPVHMQVSATSAAAPDVPVFVPPLILPFPPGAGPSEILRGIRRFDRIANWIGLGIIVVVGVQTLWLNTLSWGSLSDYITAFLAGAGLQFGFGSAISGLRTAMTPIVR